MAKVDDSDSDEELSAEVLALIADRMARRKTALQEREKAKEKARNRNNFTTINVSGRRFLVDIEIFSRFPDTLLGSTMKQHFYDPSKKEYFFDRDPEVFKYIITFYKTGKLHYPEEECACCFETECAYFGILADIMSDCCHEPYGEQKEDFDDYLKRNKPALGLTDPDSLKGAARFRCKMWQLFEEPSGNIFGLMLHYISAVFIAVSVVTSVVETVPCGITTCGKKYEYLFFVLEAICVCLFSTEYACRLYSAPERWLFMKKFLSIIDLIAILPFYAGLIVPEASSGPFTVLRVFRIFRIVKMSRHSTKVRAAGSSLKDSFSELSFVFVVLAALIILFSSVIYYSESVDPNSNFTSIPATFWYTIVTMTTLGYGDLVPESLVGRLTGALCSLSGILVVALPAPVLEKNMKKARKGENDDRIPLTYQTPARKKKNSTRFQQSSTSSSNARTTV